MIRFRVEEPSAITMTAGVDNDGDFAVRANGVAMLWVMKDGTILLNDNEREPLLSMGFQMDGVSVKVPR